jgi:hypothetical protein
MPNPAVSPGAFSISSGILASAVAAGGTVAVGYPLLQPGTVNPQVKNKGHFFGVGGHMLIIGQSLLRYPNDFEVTLGTPAAGITLTNRTTGAWPAGAAFRLQLNEMGAARRLGNQQLFPSNVVQVVGSEDGGLVLLNLTAPVALSATAICALQAIAGAANALINGVNAVGGVAYMDVPRAVRVVSAGAGDITQTVTVFGTDAYGQAMRETIALNGTTVVPGKKAFFTVNRVAVSAVMAGNLSVGSTDVLGLPALLPAAGYIVKELQDGAAPTAGTTVAGVATTPTATTGDVRGTYLPNAATDGTKALQLLVFLANPADIGAQQLS